MLKSGTDVIGIYYTYKRDIELVFWDYYTGDRLECENVKICDIVKYEDVECLTLKPIKDPDRETVFCMINEDYSDHSFLDLPGKKIYEMMIYKISESTIIKASHSKSRLFNTEKQKSILVKHLLTRSILPRSPDDSLIVKQLVDEVCFTDTISWKNVTKLVAGLAKCHSLPYRKPSKMILNNAVTLSYGRAIIPINNPDFSFLNQKELEYLREYIQSLIDIGDSNYIPLLIALENYLASI